MIDYIQQGLDKNLIHLDEDQKYITYIHQNKKRNFQNPEEKVQAAIFCKLILHYGYPESQIVNFVHVQLGVDSSKEADIVVYMDKEKNKSYIVVECKKEKTNLISSLNARKKK